MRSVFWQGNFGSDWVNNGVKSLFLFISIVFLLFIENKTQNRMKIVYEKFLKFYAIASGLTKHGKEVEKVDFPTSMALLIS